MARRTKFTTWLDAETACGVRDLAATHQLTVSEITSALLREALKHHAADAGANLLVVEIRHVVRTELRAVGNRLAHLLARTALESIAARREIFNLLAHQQDARSAQAIREGSWKAAVDSLRRPLQELRQVLDDTASDTPASVSARSGPDDPEG